MRHSVSQVDPEQKTGTCLVCGPTSVYGNPGYSGKGAWRCATKSLTDAKGWHEKNPDARTDARFMRVYGITLKQYDEMLVAQSGVCARCTDPPSANRRLAVDHDHETGVVRKLLCGPCNTYLGRLEAHRHRLAEDLAYLDSGEFKVAEPITRNF